MLALGEIDNILWLNGRSLRDYPPMPILDLSNALYHVNRPEVKELDYDKEALQMEYNRLKSNMMNEQKKTY